MKEKRPGLFLYAEMEEEFKTLSDEDAGKLIKAIYHYNNTGEVPELDGLATVFISFRRAIDENKSRYADICEKRKAAADTRWKKAGDEDFRKVKETLSAYLARAVTAKEERRLEELREQYGNTLIYLAIRESRQLKGRTLKYVEKILNEYVVRGYDKIYRDRPLKEVYRGFYD